MKQSVFRRVGLTFLVVFASLWIATPAIAYKPIRSESQLAAPVRETVVRVPTARVVLADYGLIRRDFAETRAMNDARIDEWLLSKTAFVSQAQAGQTVANTQITVSGETTQALRPRDYGRALVFETGQGGLIDAKGAGAAIAPRPGGHSDGLATLGEATREFLYEKLVRTVLAHSGSDFETVEHYAVIDLGFDVKHAEGTTSPAGLILRQAHSRAPGQFSLFNNVSARQVELILRRYGLTSAGAYRGSTTYSEQINVQGTPDGGILDFGGYIAEEAFSRPARNFYDFRDLLTPDQIDFVQPDPRIRVPMKNWGYSDSGVDDPKLDNPWMWSHELAQNYRAGIATRAAFRVHFENLVGTYRRELFILGGEAKPQLMEALVRAVSDIH